MDTQPGSKIILGMIMLKDENSLNLDAFRNDFERVYDGNSEKHSGDKVSYVFEVDGEMASITQVNVPIPSGDIEETAKYAYNWPTAIEDAKDHKTHLIVSLMQGGQDHVKRFKILTQILCSLLRTTNAIGVYMGKQSLLIPKDDYLNEAQGMSDEYLPLNLWIYFGLYVSDNSTAGYTYGLKEFDKAEMEIVNSSKGLEEIREFLFNISHYVLEYDVVFKDGETAGISDEERISINLSEGHFIDGDTFKLAY